MNRKEQRDEIRKLPRAQRRLIFGRWRRVVRRPRG